MIEVIEFYPIEKNETNGFLSGTLRIRLPELGIDILGVYASKNKNGWSFRLPNGKSIHHETGAPCWYPFISFQDKERQKQLMEEINGKGKAFIDDRLSDKENPLVFLGNPFVKKKHVTTNKNKEKPVEAKETVTVEKTKPVSSIANKVWVDPPTRKIVTAQKMRTGRTS